MPSRLHTRLTRLEAEASGVPTRPGLSNLLAYAQRHFPTEDAEALDEAQLAQTGLGRLLLEARQVRAKDGC
jgi:hypothetical protein